MPDLVSGSEIYAADWPPSVTWEDVTTLSNLSNLGYQTLSPALQGTFVAPTSGRVLITVGGTAFDNGGPLNRVYMVPQVFKGTSAAGVEVLPPNVGVRGSAHYGGRPVGHSRITLLEGLEPGETYFARHLSTVTGGTTCRINSRQLIIEPTT